MDQPEAPSAPASCRECGVAIRPGALTCREHSAATIAARGTEPPPGTRRAATAQTRTATAPPPAPPAATWAATRATPAWSPPSYAGAAAPARQGRLAVWLASVAAAVVVVYVAAATVGLLRHEAANRDADRRVASYVQGTSAQPFAAADGHFRASFPTTPKRFTRELDVPGGTAELVGYVGGSEKRTAFAVSTIVLDGRPYDLNVGLDGAAAAVKGKVESTAPTTFDGYPAVEGVVALPSGHTAKMLIVQTPLRVFLLDVVDVHDPTAGYERFKGSLQLIP